MLDLSTLLIFSATAFALTASPGPDMLLIATRSVTQGRSAGLATWAGIAIGTYLHTTVAAFGLSQLILSAPALYEVIRLLGVSYLLYLAYKNVTAKPCLSLQSDEKGGLSISRIFRQGLMGTSKNPIQ